MSYRFFSFADSIRRVPSTNHERPESGNKLDARARTYQSVKRKRLGGLQKSFQVSAAIATLGDGDTQGGNASSVGPFRGIVRRTPIHHHTYISKTRTDPRTHEDGPYLDAGQKYTLACHRRRYRRYQASYHIIEKDGLEVRSFNR